MPVRTKSIYLPFVSIEKGVTEVDGVGEVPVRIVRGIMTDETLDSDGQILDYEASKAAAVDWFNWANIREQHSSKAIGTGIEIEYNDPLKQIVLTSKVVDSDAIVKLDEEVLKGYSVGVKQWTINKDAGAPNGRVLPKKYAETSLVDHPANESCRITILKSAGAGKFEPGEGLIYKGADVPQEGVLNKADQLAGSEAFHNDALNRARQAFRDLITQEASETDFDPGDIAQLAYAAQDLERWAEWEAYEQADDAYEAAMAAFTAAGAVVLEMAAEPDLTKRRGQYKVVAQALHSVMEKHPKPGLTKAADAPVAETPAVAVEPQVEAIAPAAEPAAASPDAPPAAASTEPAEVSDGAAPEGEAPAAEATSTEPPPAPAPPVEPEKAATPAATIPPESLNKLATPEAMKAMTGELLKSAEFAGAVQALVESGQEPLRKSIAEMEKRLAPGGPLLLGRRLIEAPEQVKASYLASQLESAEAYLDSPDPTIRMWAKQAVAVLQKDS